MHLSLWIGWAFLACDAARAELLLPRTSIIAAFLSGSLTGAQPQYTYDDFYYNFDDDYYNGHYLYYDSDDNYIADDDDGSCSQEKECPNDMCCHPDSNKCGRTSEYCHDVDGENQCCPTLPDGDYRDCYPDSICEEAETPWYEHPGFIAAASIVCLIASVLCIYSFIRINR